MRKILPAIIGSDPDPDILRSGIVILVNLNPDPQFSSTWNRIRMTDPTEPEPEILVIIKPDPQLRPIQTRIQNADKSGPRSTTLVKLNPDP